MGNGESRQMRNNARSDRSRRSNNSSSRSSNAPLNISPNNMNNAQAGAYKMPGQPKNNRYYVTIPRGVRPGQHFAVLVNGVQMMVKCPDHNQPGDRLIVTAPRQQNQQYVVMVRKSLVIAFKYIYIYITLL